MTTSNRAKRRHFFRAILREAVGAHRRLVALNSRGLWLVLAVLLASHHLILIETTQQSAGLLVFALLVWGGALIGIEDQLATLQPRASRMGLLLGTTLLVIVLLRCSAIVGRSWVIYLVPPLEGLALALLCAPPSQLGRFRHSLAILALLPLSLLGARLIPEEALSLNTARISAVLLQALGFEAAVEGRQLLLTSGSVVVSGPCNGADLLMLVVAVAVIFLLAFPLRSWRHRALVLALAPLLAILCNSVRIALLALIHASAIPHRLSLFKFFHEEAGSLVFSGVAVSLLALLYLRVLDRELGPPTALDGHG